VLAAAGAGALILNVPIGIAIALLMVIVTTSYRQVVRGYPSGGGSYAVARANLGLIFGLIAAAALLIDYVLTVAVSVSSSVDALASAFAALSSYKVPIGLALVGPWSSGTCAVCVRRVPSSPCRPTSSSSACSC
jgi:amino acid transporter